MKKFIFATFIALFAVALLLVFARDARQQKGNRSSGKAKPKILGPDRARLARVTASSFRLARLEEIPRAEEFSDILMDRENNWPRRLPLYAADGSPLTFWATSGSKDEYIEYDFTNRLAETAPVAAVEIQWGRHRPSIFQITASTDGKHWQVLVKNDAAGKETFSLSFDQPVQAGYLRVSCNKGRTGKGFTIKRFAVYGPATEPQPPGELQAEAVDGKRVRLEWSGSSVHGVYRYCLFRDTEKGFAPARSNRVACTDRKEFTDVVPKGGTYYYALVAESFGGGRSSVRRAGPVTLSGPVQSPFEFRGVVEGFYNDPWPHPERLKMISFLARAGMNYYLYAPKQDPYHRQWWRKPYPEKELENFRELQNACKAHGITFNFGISPGLDYSYDDDSDFRKLCDKLDSLYELGVRSFTLCMDDITGWKHADAHMARQQVKLANRLHSRLRAKDPESELIFVPTVYMRTYDYWKKKKPDFAGYLREVKKLDPQIEVMWTGPGMIFSEEISAESAGSMEKVWGRKPVIWDNVPVNDVTLRRHIIMAPYQGRSAKLFKSCKGALLNPMYLPNSSMVTVFTAGRYLEDPQIYAPHKAYEYALREIAGKDCDAFHALADALAYHPLFPGQGVAELPLTRKLDAFRKAKASGQKIERAEQDLRELFATYVNVPEKLGAELDNFELKKELEPAAKKLSIYGKAGLLALDYLEADDKEKKTDLMPKIERLRQKAGGIPWKVADNSLEGLYTPPGSKRGRHENVMEEFLEWSLSR